MSVADAASVRTVAVELRSLFADTDNQPIIAREDGCMRALAGFVAGNDVQVAAMAVATLKSLASHVDNFDVPRSEDALFDALRDLLVSEEAAGDLRQDIFDILEELTDENDDDEMDELDELEKAAGLKEKDPAFEDEPGLLKEPLTARIHVPGISDDVTCMRVEQLIIRKRGVILVAFEIGAEVAVVYIRNRPEELASFIGTMTETAVDLLPELQSNDEEDESEAKSDKDTDIDNAEKKNGGGQPEYVDKSGQTFRAVAKNNAKRKTPSRREPARLLRDFVLREKKSRGRRLEVIDSWAALVVASIPDGDFGDSASAIITLIEFTRAVIK